MLGWDPQVRDVVCLRRFPACWKCRAFCKVWWKIPLFPYLLVRGKLCTDGEEFVARIAAADTAYSMETRWLVAAILSSLLRPRDADDEVTDPTRTEVFRTSCVLRITIKHPQDKHI